MTEHTFYSVEYIEDKGVLHLIFFRDDTDDSVLIELDPGFAGALGLAIARTAMESMHQGPLEEAADEAEEEWSEEDDTEEDKEDWQL